jgi:hypothetical protein
MTTSVPGRRSAARANGIMVRTRIGGLVVRLAVRCLCSRNITGSSQRMAVRSSPTASAAVEGNAMRRPGQCAKMLSPDWLWYTPPPRRYPPIATRMTTGALNELAERYLSIESSSRICIMAGQM